MLPYLVVGTVAAVATYILTFLWRKLAWRIGAVAIPNERSVHNRPTPTAGGAAMFGALLIALAVASRLTEFVDVFAASSEVLGVIGASAVILAVGLIDDLREVSAPSKVAGQVIAAMVLYFLGVTLYYFRIPFADLVVLSPDLLPLFTVMWVVVIANAVNLIDGLDGLAAGIVGIASGAFFVYAFRLREVGLLDSSNIGPLIAVITAGVCIGFLPHNFSPARIFMGDAGALLLGLLLAASTMVVGGRTADQFSGQTYFFFAPVVIPFVILGVPVVDTVFALVRRTIRREGFSSADKKHLHHRLIQLGHSPRRAVVLLWMWTAVLSGFVLLPPLTGSGNALVLPGIVALAIVLYTALRPVMGSSPSIDDDPEPALVGAESAAAHSSEVLDITDETSTSTRASDDS